MMKGEGHDTFIRHDIRICTTNIIRRMEEEGAMGWGVGVVKNGFGILLSKLLNVFLAGGLCFSLSVSLAQCKSVYKSSIKKKKTKQSRLT